jgi:adenine-specific DNA-methyltransferase
LYKKGKKKGEMLELYATPLELIPLKKITEATQKPFIKFVDQILNDKKAGKDTRHLENKIDLMVYKLYELTYEEIKIVDPEVDKVLASFGLSKTNYEHINLDELAVLVL